MRGVKVKRLRARVYGEGSKRNEYRYEYRLDGFRCLGKRAEYQREKKGA